MNKKIRASRNKQMGAGFIEVLIALVILAIGLLGLMSMQARGLSSNQRAFFATEVNQLAYDIADRIFAYGTSGADASQYAGVSTVTACGDPCNDPVVSADRDAWSDAFDDASLPSGRGDVTALNNVYTITIRWDEERTGATGTDCASTDRDGSGNLVNLTCFQMTVRL